jgi:uncharacterized protein (TIGR02466 family)
MAVPIFSAEFFHRPNIGLDKISQLQEEILSAKKTEANTEYTNDRCWRSSRRYNISWLIDEVLSLANQAVNFYQDKDSVFQSSHKNKSLKINYWTNVNSPGARNVLHSHSDCCFSCVYYIQATGTGDLRLLNPANLMGKLNRQSPFTRDFYFSPVEGDLILWPAWVPHEVEPNLSNKDRINITFDITV